MSGRRAGAGRGRRGCAAAGLLLLAWSGWSAAGDAVAWKRIAESQGVTVDQKISVEPGIPTVRAVTQVDASLYEVLPVLLDSARHTEWMPSCLESRAVHHDGDVRYVYNRSEAPWPFSDRDVVLRSHVVMVEPAVEVWTPFESIEDPAVPPRPDAVRLPLLRGHYRLRALAPRRTEVELQLELDPGGHIPNWLIRRVSERNSVSLLVALREQVRATLGSYDAFMKEFLASGEYETPAAPADGGPPGRPLPQD